MKALVPQERVRDPVLYLLFTSDIPSLYIQTIATFTDDTAVMAVPNNYDNSLMKMQTSINCIES